MFQDSIFCIFSTVGCGFAGGFASENGTGVNKKRQLLYFIAVVFFFARFNFDTFFFECFKYEIA